MQNRKTLIVYKDSAGKEPFSIWLKGIRDTQNRRRILNRLFDLEHGHYGDVKSVGGGVYELRLFFGPGYRIYFGQENNTFVILLCAGDKDTQKQDIAKAHKYWNVYQEEKS
jgi:putative addiction module killer protein